MPIGLSIAGFLGCYLLAALSFAAVFQRWKFPFATARANFVCAAPLGPIALAWIQWVLLRFLPGMSAPAYIGLSLLPLMIVMILHWRGLTEIVAATVSRIPAGLFGFPKDSYDRRAWTVAFIWLGGSILLLITSIHALGMPMMASDPLEYASLAEVIYYDRSLANYPLDPSNDQGFYARSAHPPALHMMIVFSYFWQGAAESSRVLRFINFYYMFAFVALMVLVAREASLVIGRTQTGRDRDARDMAGALALLLTFGVPFYVSLIVAFHIDPMRIALFGLGFVFAARLLVWERSRGAERDDSKGDVLRDPGLFAPPVLLTGIAVGLGMFAHSIGLLLLPFTQFAYFFTTRSSFWRRCAVCTVFGVIALLLGAGQYVQNTIDYGVPLHDTEPIWELPQVDHKTDVRFRRDLVTLGQRIQNGLLVWFYAPTLYGFVHFLALFSLLAFAKSIWRNVMGRVMIMGAGVFYALAILTMSLGVDMIIKNIRYMLTIMPFLVVIAAVGGGKVYAKILAFARHRADDPAVDR
ncbi:hypothetical protein ACFFUB_11485 [Algimonas porphyrae]|uniref:Uncharacterized protein n=1 Tax=Algimonas porphyrae TaxID=1128113 RepID=A0ABQ5V352_9PROT|nr:hypothetical protein [Algimonas porphyrae]GLQ21963.1 hypothetical protein GCM10007854_29180 [Algimonas porphyrae]